MIDPDVRSVAPHDGAVLAQLPVLEAEARAALIDQRGGERWLLEHPPVGDGWTELAADADVVVAEIDEVVVGYLVALDCDELVVIDQVWVTPEARELGFGDALLALAIDRARSRGAEAVQGSALPGDRHTKNLYERAGIVARLITTYRRFD